MEIHIAEGANFIVNGAIIADGNLENGIVFKGLVDQEAWGAITLLNTSDTSVFNFVTIIDASLGSIPTRDKGALSLFKANVKLNHLNITEVHNNPIFSQYSWVSMDNSILQSKITGDLINVKYGNAFIQNTTFVGNSNLIWMVLIMMKLMKERLRIVIFMILWDPIAMLLILQKAVKTLKLTA